jgi:RsiW-degrading membrane proteinase PrsW (M82 family)
MTYTPLQIGITFLSLLGTIFIALLWQDKDRKSEKKKSDTESFAVLMSVFFYAAFGTLVLKMLLDLGVHFYAEQMQTSYVQVLSIFAEEIVKAAALIIGLNIAGKRFNETSDGIMYAVFAALGFIFYENIVYLLSASPDIWTFIRIFLGRNIFSFAAHLSICAFGVFYAGAYLHSKKLRTKLKKKSESRIKPYDLVSMLKFLWHKYSVLIILYLPLSPFFLFFQTIMGKKAHITMSEMLIGGFLSSVYLHLSYNYLLEINIPSLNTLALLIVGIIGVTLHHFFPKLDVK